MRYRQLGTSDLQVSEICLGTMTWGQQNSVNDACEQLDYAVSRGVNFVDAAEIYPVPNTAETQGRTEECLGEWLSKHKRDELIVATKITGPTDRVPWIRERNGKQRIDRENITEATDLSLQRLKTDHIDLYQIHWPDRYVAKFGEPDYDPSREWDATPIQEQLEVFGDLIRAGKVRYLGLSNETPWGVSEFCRLAREQNLPMAVSIQNAFSLVNRVFHTHLAETCHNHDVGLMAYSCLAFGYLTGKYLDGAPAGSRLDLFPKFGFRYNKPYLKSAVRGYVDVARAHGLSPTQLALAWVRGRWFVTSTIIGATTLEQLEENIDAFDITLDPKILRDIDKVHAQFPNPAP